jgi:GxxExxY protein
MLKHNEITEKILKGFYEVYNELGRGFLESVYENALTLLLKEYGLSVKTQEELNVRFHGQLVGVFRADMIVEGKVLLELKAVRSLDAVHEAQLLNYLKATGIEIGLLLNFGNTPEFKRRVFNTI